MRSPHSDNFRPLAPKFGLLLSAVAALAAACCSILAAQEFQNVQPLDGWVSGVKPGVKMEGSAVGYSSPVAANIDGNLANGFEIAAATSDGRLTVYQADGSLLWSVNLPNFGCGKANQRVSSSPAVGELFGNGVPYVVVGYGGLGPSDAKCGGGLAAYHGPSGKRRFNLDLKRYDQRRYKRERGVPRERLYTVFSTPALADVNNDGKLEIGFGSFDRHVYLLNARGKVLWHYQAADTVWSSPAFANVDDDPDLEMIIGTDISGNKSIKPPTTNGGYLYAFKTRLSPTLRARYGKKKNVLIRFRDSDHYLWQTWFNQTIFSSPVLADILPNNPGLEVVVGSGYYFPEGNGEKNGKWLKILDARTGKVLETLDQPACSSASPALADLDHDGLPEVITLVNGHSSFGGDGPVHLSAWNPATKAEIWNVNLAEETPYMYFNSPIAADLDDNGSLEIIVAHKTRLRIFAGDTGEEYSCAAECLTEELDLRGGASFHNTPIALDINGDGRQDLIAAGGFSPKAGALYAWTNFGAALRSSPGPDGPKPSVGWPMGRGSASRQGDYSILK